MKFPHTRHISSETQTGSSADDRFPFISTLVHLGSPDHAAPLAPYFLQENDSPAIYFTDCTIVRMFLRAAGLIVILAGRDESCDLQCEPLDTAAWRITREKVTAISEKIRSRA